MKSSLSYSLKNLEIVMIKVQTYTVYIFYICNLMLSSLIVKLSSHLSQTQLVPINCYDCHIAI